MQEQYPYKTGYLYVPIEFSTEKVPRTVDFGGDTLKIKERFHVSLVCLRNMISTHGEGIGQKVLDFFYTFAEHEPLEFEGFSGEYRLAEQTRGNEYRKTIVGMCVVSNIDKFYRELNQEFGTNFDTQPTHVTLYTLGKNNGIGINNLHDLKHLTRNVTDELTAQHPELLDVIVS